MCMHTSLDQTNNDFENQTKKRKTETITYIKKQAKQTQRRKNKIIKIFFYITVVLIKLPRKFGCGVTQQI